MLSLTDHRPICLLAVALSLTLPVALTALDGPSLFCLISGNGNVSTLTSSCRVLSALLHGSNTWKVTTIATRGVEPFINSLHLERRAASAYGPGPSRHVDLKVGVALGRSHFRKGWQPAYCLWQAMNSETQGKWCKTVEEWRFLGKQISANP